MMMLQSLKVILVISNLRLYLNSSHGEEKHLEKTKTFPKLDTTSFKGVYIVVQKYISQLPSSSSFQGLVLLTKSANFFLVLLFINH